MKSKEEEINEEIETNAEAEAEQLEEINFDGEDEKIASQGDYGNAFKNEEKLQKLKGAEK